MFWALLDIITFEAAEIMLPQNVWIQLFSNAESVSESSCVYLLFLLPFSNEIWNNVLG